MLEALALVAIYGIMVAGLYAIVTLFPYPINIAAAVVAILVLTNVRVRVAINKEDKDA